MSTATDRTLGVLVVDDEPTVRRLLVRIVKSLGHNTTTAADAEEAIACLETERYDLLITDYGLPGQTGMALAEKVRERWPATRIILITGWGSGTDKGSADYLLAKPFTTADLEAAIAAVMGET